MYTEEGLALRRKRPWRHTTAVHREQRRPAAARNDIWSMDFVADAFTDGRRVQTLTILDLFTRQCLDIAVGRGLTGQDVVAALERPASIVICRSASTATMALSEEPRQVTSAQSQTAVCAHRTGVRYPFRAAGGEAFDARSGTSRWPSNLSVSAAATSAMQHRRPAA